MSLDYLRRFTCDNKATTTALVALWLPVLTLLLAALVDVGLVMVHKERLTNAAEFGAQAGGVAIGGIVIEKAEAHNPPDDATDPLLYLTDEDRAAIMNDSRVRAAVDSIISKNLDVSDPLLHVTVVYPNNTIDCTNGVRSVELKVITSFAQKSLPLE